MSEILKSRRRRALSRRDCLFCVLAQFAPIFLSGCMSGTTESLAAVVKPGALADDMQGPAPTMVTRLQQSDGDDKPNPNPPNPPLLPPAPKPDLTLPPAPHLPGAPLTKEMIAVRAWVNGNPLYDDEFNLSNPNIERLVAQVHLFPNDPKIRENIATLREKLIDDELMYQDAVNKLDKSKSNVLDKLKKEADKKYDEFLYNHRKNFQKNVAVLSDARRHQEEGNYQRWLRDSSCLLRRFHERKFIAEEYMKSRIIPILQALIGPNEVKQEYDSHMDMYIFPGKIKWQDVFIASRDFPTSAEARNYAERLRAHFRDDFTKMIPYDKGDSKSRGGDGIGSHPTYTREGKSVPTDIRPIEMEPHLLKLNEGETAIVEMSTGVHIIRLVKYEKSFQRPFDREVQIEIRNKLRGEIFEKEYKYLVRELRSRANIVIVAD